MATTTNPNEIKLFFNPLKKLYGKPEYGYLRETPYFGTETNGTYTWILQYELPHRTSTYTGLLYDTKNNTWAYTIVPGYAGQHTSEKEAKARVLKEILAIPTTRTQRIAALPDAEILRALSDKELTSHYATKELEILKTIAKQKRLL